MKKPSFIIGKKQIILTCMTLMLGIAVYVNYALTDKEVPVKKSVSVNADISASESSVNTAESSTPTENEDSVEVRVNPVMIPEKTTVKVNLLMVKPQKIFLHRLDLKK